jgi:polysaccharide export outer membrane protein
MALTGLVALVACGGDQSLHRMPTPSAARGGVQPHQFSSIVAEAVAPPHIEAPIAAPIIEKPVVVPPVTPPVSESAKKGTQASETVAPLALVSPSNTGIGHEYVLGTGDEIRLTVYGEDDLSGQYEISSTGIVALPLVGNVQAAGHTISQFEGLVREKMTQGYLKDPRVSVQVTNYRPFFILGEVAKPGSYPYVNGMTVLSAVALAGGYTYRADKGDIRVTHANVPTKEEQDSDERTNVIPGDIIRVTERFF